MASSFNIKSIFTDICNSLQISVIELQICAKTF